MKQRINSLKIHKFTLTKGNADYIGENDIGNSSTMEETDSKIIRVEQLRTAYRQLHMKITLPDRCDEEQKDYEKKLVNNEE